MENKKLTRSNNRMLAGVCAGLADYFGWDVTIVRIIYSFATVFTAFSGIIVYIILWIVMPEKKYRADDSRKNEFHGLRLNHDIRINETDIICVEHSAYSNQSAADKGRQHLIFEWIDSDCVGRVFIFPHRL